MITEGSSITLLLRKRYAFWTDAPRGIVERIGKNMQVEFKCDEFLALPVDPKYHNSEPKHLLHVHHIRAKELKYG